jgi:N-acetylmuramoyl-L-alanine amidase
MVKRLPGLSICRKKQFWMLLGLIVIGLIGWFWWFSLKYWSTKPAGPAQVVVCIDPGHPSESNSGLAVQHGTCETRINWEVALKLQSILAQDKRIKVIKTRNSCNQFLRNRRRALIGNDARASINIHLHCDAGPARGFTVYYPDKEGKAEGKAGPTADVLESSKKAAEIIHSGMSDVLNGVLKDRGIRGESFTRVGKINGALTTSVFSQVPVVTVEMVFLSNRSDAEFIKSDKGQEKMAAALAEGIRDFIKPDLEDYDRQMSAIR